MFVNFFFSFYVFLDDGCVSLRVESEAFNGEVKYVPMNWFETPSIVYKGQGGNILFIKRARQLAA